MFGSNNHVLQPQGKLTDNFIKSQYRLNSHVKSFVRPSCAIRVESPHYYKIQNGLRCYHGNGKPMKLGPFNNFPIPFTSARAYIAHYFCQSEEEYIRRKTRMLDDGTHKTIDNNFHKMYNDVFNTQLLLANS